MKKLAFAAMIFAFSASASLAGNCAHSWQTASDGSSCGDRAADQRDGGQ